ncbi:MAG: thiamine-phosphate kinase [Bacteroidales bacterium]|nr:thiamine-phosphate kinase [Bacteroidales bacterium]
MMEKQRTLEEVGEFGLIDILTKPFSTSETTIKGVGDDCAVLPYSESEYALVTTDLLMEGIHFDLVYSPLKHIGYKAVMVNASDVYAMNGTPKKMTVSIAVSAKFSVDALEQLYEGMRIACERIGVELIGGDTSASMTGLAISITMLGTVAKDKVVYRSGAKPTDLICVSGDLGAAYAGLQVLQREKAVFNGGKGAQPKLEGYEYPLQRILKPEARYDILEELAKHNIVPTSMIDVSDGLTSELFHICTQSKVGCKIYEERLPINVQTAEVCKEFSVEPLIPALHGGEDYELLFTVPLTQYEEVKKIKDISIIGNIAEASQEMGMISRSGDFVHLKAQGWNAAYVKK